MDTETFSPAIAARQIGIPANTLRNWCRTYAEFLSPSANPPTGEERRLTLHDIETLRAVAALRANDLPPETIIARLRANPASITEGIPKPSASATDGPGDVADVPHVQTTAIAQHDALQAFLGQHERLTSIDRRLERLEHGRNMVLIALAGVAVGALVVGIIAVLVLLLR